MRAVSSASASPSGTRSASCTFAFIPPNASVGPAASSRAQAIQASGNSASGTTRLTRPRACASGASSDAFDTSSSSAPEGPTRRGRNHAPPESPENASRAHPVTNRAAGAAVRKAPASANDMPPPTAGPLPAAIVSFGCSCTRRATCASASSAAARASGSTRSRSAGSAFTSPPAQNAEPAPVSTTTPMSSSRAKSSSACVIGRCMSRWMALRRSGRFRVITPTRSCRAMVATSANVPHQRQAVDAVARPVDVEPIRVAERDGGAVGGHPSILPPVHPAPRRRWGVCQDAADDSTRPGGMCMSSTIGHRRAGHALGRSLRRAVAVAVTGIAVIGAAMVAPGAAQTADSTGVTAKEIKVGYIYSKGGLAGSTFENAADGFNARVKEENAKGGVNGRKIVPVIADDSGSSNNLVAAQNLVQNEKVFLVVDNSPFAFLAYRFLLDNGVPMVGGGYDGNEYGQPGNEKLISILGNNSPVYGAQYKGGFVDLMKKAGAKNVGTVSYGSSAS